MDIRNKIDVIQVDNTGMKDKKIREIEEMI